MVQISRTVERKREQRDEARCECSRAGFANRRASGHACAACAVAESKPDRVKWCFADGAKGGGAASPPARASRHPPQCARASMPDPSGRAAPGHRPPSPHASGLALWHGLFMAASSAAEPSSPAHSARSCALGTTSPRHATRTIVAFGLSMVLKIASEWTSHKAVRSLQYNLDQSLWPANSASTKRPGGATRPPVAERHQCGRPESASRPREC
jgi:hypothetical protein